MRGCYDDQSDQIVLCEYAVVDELAYSCTFRDLLIVVPESSERRLQFPAHQSGTYANQNPAWRWVGLLGSDNTVSTADAINAAEAGSVTVVAVVPGEDPHGDFTYQATAKC